MNVYDKINELADALRNSNEMKEYIEIKKEVFKQPKNKETVESFRNKQIEVQQLVMQGKEEEAVKKEELLKQMYKILLDNEDIKKMFDAEVRFDVLVGDMYRILGEAIREAMED